jgi:hypothetical protein
VCPVHRPAPIAATTTMTHDGQTCQNTEGDTNQPGRKEKEHAQLGARRHHPPIIDGLWSEKRSGDARAMQNSQNIGADTNQPGFGKRTGPGKRPSQVAILSVLYDAPECLYSQNGRERADERPILACRSCCLSSEEQNGATGFFPRIISLSLRFGKRPLFTPSAAPLNVRHQRERRLPARSWRAASVIPPRLRSGLRTAGRRKRGGGAAAASAALGTAAGGACE